MGRIEDPDWGNLAIDGCPCGYPYGVERGCVCGPSERVLRHVSGQGLDDVFTEAQRDWCMDQIFAVEGWNKYERPSSDADLARHVMNAWVDYCRDKGTM